MAASVNHDLECEVCCEQFNHESRKPKLLPCGHTMCLACSQSLYREAQRKGENAFLCPVDREKTNWHPEKLKTNFYILSLIQGSHQTEKPREEHPRFWCVDCEAVAGSSCEEEHTIRRLHQERRRQMKPTVELLEKAVSTQCLLVEKLEAIGTSSRDFMKQQVAEAREALERGKAALTLLDDSLDLVGPGWDHAEAEVEATRRSSSQRLAADEQSLQLLAAEGECQVTVSVPGGAWRAHVDLAADGQGMAVVRGLLVHMQRTDMLRWEEKVGHEDKLGRGPIVEISSSASQQCVVTSRQAGRPPVPEALLHHYDDAQRREVLQRLAIIHAEIRAPRCQRQVVHKNLNRVDHFRGMHRRHFYP